MWVPITLAAATFQILRTSQQHRLRPALSTNGAGFVRYAYGFPLACVAATITFVAVGLNVPSVPLRFWPIVTLAGVAQIGGTVALLKSFELRDFAIGTVYSKSEVIIVAIVSAVGLGESLRPLGWVGAVAVMIGVVALAAPGRASSALATAADPAALMGLLAGLGFAIAAAGIRGASQSLDGSNTWGRALLTLTAMLGIQFVINASQLAWSDRDQLRAVAVEWRAALPVGILSLAGSAGWATAVTLTNAAKVRTLGQVELLIAFAVSSFWLREPHSRSEYAASAIVLAGVIVVAVAG